METPSQRQVTQVLQSRLLVQNSKTHGASRQNRGGPSVTTTTTGTMTLTVRTATTAAASTPGATWTTTTRTAATTSTSVLALQYRHVAHRLAANYFNRNTQHGRDNNNLTNHRAPTTATTALATAQESQQLKQARKTNMVECVLMEFKLAEMAPAQLAGRYMVTNSGE